ncbi:lysophospholipid acyltransferase family protein [Mesorhizobium sp. LHD-90]|uniref:lysophospholipid acyltransferase family protein n=1 Tax=Mesorhizobium sp. LHD-90 TaxID=3071414 RepID=UPI0027E01027|nr:lysophospholipid acyltransferase family protein [Mesorhizobium sp. LHD-90]MDQ6435048.1 lysophospholipid acyltransferase family protein [Mesorhizobium sp. LHD-90]
MTDNPVAPSAIRAGAKKRRKVGGAKGLWRRIRQPLAQSTVAKSTLATLLAGALRLVRSTNRYAAGSSDIATSYEKITPSILAIWHGQHLMAPVLYPRGKPLSAMVSRSADAELNALVVEKFGFEAVRGSGGREDKKKRDRGGAQALIALKKVLEAGSNVCMIADIPHGTPRQAGMGIVTLARLSGRPVVPVAMTTSRRKVLEKTWDKTTINLPFGRCAMIVGEPIAVPADADDAEMERKRQEITAALNEVTERVYRIVDRRA